MRREERRQEAWLVLALACDWSLSRKSPINAELLRHARFSQRCQPAAIDFKRRHPQPPVVFHSGRSACFQIHRGKP